MALFGWDARTVRARPPPEGSREGKPPAPLGPGWLQSGLGLWVACAIRARPPAELPGEKDLPGN